MRLLARSAFLPLLAVAALGLQLRSSQPPLSVPAREVPVPSCVSPALQKRIAEPVPRPAETPTTAEAWNAMQQQNDVGAAQVARAAAAALGTRVEATEVAGIPCYRVTPKAVAPEKQGFLLVHVHGGAFVFNGGIGGTSEASLLADACRMPVLSIDYRRPPEHPFPAASDDVLAVWKAVAKEHDPRTVVMGGTSAGGGLILTTMLRCKAEGVAMPAALFLGTPGTDLTKTGDSMYLNAEVDNVIGRYDGFIEACCKLYANGRDLADPLLSPVNGDLAGLPPTVLITGTRDLLLSATARTHRKLRAAGVTAELHVYEGMSHADYLAAFGAPEARDALSEVAGFFDRALLR